MPSKDCLTNQLNKILEMVKTEKKLGKLHIIFPSSQEIEASQLSSDLTCFQEKLYEALLIRSKKLQSLDDIFVTNLINSDSKHLLENILNESRTHTLVNQINQSSPHNPSQNSLQGLPFEVIMRICSYLTASISGSLAMKSILIQFPIKISCLIGNYFNQSSYTSDANSEELVKWYPSRK